MKLRVLHRTKWREAGLIQKGLIFIKYDDLFSKKEGKR